LRENMTVIAASRDTQPGIESGGHGLFTAALLYSIGDLARVLPTKRLNGRSSLEVGSPQAVLRT